MDRDLIRHCAECGIDFVWTVVEQEVGPEPASCPGCRKLAPAPGRQRGLVKWYSRSKGYGFITPIEGSDIFVHKSVLGSMAVSLRAGQLVEYGISHGARGAQAEQVIALEQGGESAAHEREAA